MLPMIRSSLMAEARRVVGVAGVVDNLVVPRRKLRCVMGLVWCVGGVIAVATGAGDHGGVVRFPRDVMVGLVPLLIKSPLVVVGRVRLVVGGGGVVAAPVLAVPPAAAATAAAAAMAGPLAAVVVRPAAAETGEIGRAHV